MSFRNLSNLVASDGSTKSSSGAPAAASSGIPSVYYPQLSNATQTYVLSQAALNTTDKADFQWKAPITSKAPPPVVYSSSTAPFVTPAAPLIESYTADVEYRANTIVQTIQHDLNKSTCALCEAPMKDASRVMEETSVVWFGACHHLAHLRCALRRIDADSEDKHLRGGPDSACSQCARERAKRMAVVSGTERGEAFSGNIEQLILNFKNAYREQTGESFDTLKHTQLSVQEQYELLRPASKSLLKSTLSKIAPKRLTELTSSLVKSFQEGIEELDDEHTAGSAEEKERLQHPIESVEFGKNETENQILAALANRQFVHATRLANRSFSDLLAAPNGSLLNLYRSGVQSLGELHELGFDPLIHLQKQYSNKLPLWQLCLLYEVNATTLLSEPYKLTVRNLARQVHVRAGEWPLLGMNAQQLIDLGLEANDVRHVNLSIDRWRRYLDLKKEHLSRLGLNTRRKYLTVGFDIRDEWCPSE